MIKKVLRSPNDIKQNKKCFTWNN